MGDVFAEMEGSVLEATDVEKEQSKVGEIEEVVDFPHWKIDRETLVEALAPFKEISSVANSNAVTKSVHIKRKEQTLILSGNNKDIYLEKEVPILNIEGILEGSFAVSIADLDLLVRRSFSKVIIHKPDDKFLSVRLYQSDFFLDIINVGEYLYDFVPTEGQSDLMPLDISAFSELVDIMFNAMKLSVRPEDRKVLLSGEYAYGSFLVSAVRIPFSAFSGIILRSTDLTFLKLLIKNQESLSFAYTEDRIFFYGSNFKLSTLKSESAFSGIVDSLKEMFEKDVVSEVSVSFTALYDVVFLVSKLSNTTGMIDFLSKGDDFIISYMTRSNKKSQFVIGSGRLKNKVSISIEACRKVLGLIASKSVEITFQQTDSALIIESGGIKIFMGSK